METLGIERPQHAEADFVKPSSVKGRPYWWDADRGKVKGASTLVLYVAERCARSPVCRIRAGRKDLAVACMNCAAVFKAVE
jgi:hypothetical protein